MVMVGARSEPGATGARRIPAELWDVAAEARQRLREAALEARALVESARAQADAIRARAAAEGREEGLASATEVMARAALERQDLLASSEPQLVDLAFAVAQRVLARAVERDRDAVVDIASQALEAVRQRIDVRLRVHPDDLASLRDAEPRLVERMARARCIVLLGDPSIGRGGVVVETEAGSVDARLVTQLEGLRRALGDASPSRETGARGAGDSSVALECHRCSTLVPVQPPPPSPAVVRDERAPDGVPSSRAPLDP